MGCGTKTILRADMMTGAGLKLSGGRDMQSDVDHEGFLEEELF